MNFRIVQRRNRGIALNAEGLQRVKAVTGVVLIESQHVDALSRASIVARVSPAMPLDPEPLPRLMDVTIQGMGANALVLSGVEQIDQCFYAQSWLCRFE